MVYLILILLITSFLLYLLSDQQSMVTVKKRYYNIKKYQARKKAELLQDDFNAHLRNAGLPFDLYRYQVARYSFTIVFIVWFLIHDEKSTLQFIGIVLFYLLTVPKTYIYRFRTPLKRLIDFMIHRRKKTYNREIGLFVIVMNNNFNMYKAHPPSAYKMVTDALAGTKKIRPFFEQLLRYWQTNKIQEGVEYFVKTVDTDEAKKLGSLLVKLNDLHPIELKSQLISQKDIFRDKRTVDKKNKIKSQNYFVYGIVSVLLMIILLNITQGVVKIDQ